MSLINLLDISFKNNPAPISDPYEIEIQFECLEALQNDLEWKLIYVGSGFEKDIELDSLLVGPIPIGVNKFLFTADPIDPLQIPVSDVLGVSVILLTASYDDREFVRVGFYNNNEYVDTELRQKYSALLADGTDEEKAAWKFEGVRNVEVQRNILTAKPRVTRFNIKWDNENFTDEPPLQEEEEVGGDIVDLEKLGEEGGEADEVEEEEEGDLDESAVPERKLEEETMDVDAEGEEELASGSSEDDEDEEEEEEEADEEVVEVVEADKKD